MKKHGVGIGKTTAWKCVAPNPNGAGVCPGHGIGAESRSFHMRHIHELPIGWQNKGQGHKTGGWQEESRLSYLNKYGTDHG